MSRLDDPSLIHLSKALEVYLVKCFDLYDTYAVLQAEQQLNDMIVDFHHQYIKTGTKRYPLVRIDIEKTKGLFEQVKEIQDPVIFIESLKQSSEDAIMQLCSWLLIKEVTPFCNWPMFKMPEKMQFDNLVSESFEEKKVRTNFDWIQSHKTQEDYLKEVKYCLYCHEKDKDSCSTGLVSRKDNSVYKNPLGVELNGCPLDQKISQMHQLVSEHHFIAALAVMMIDNPLCLMTGDRICRDCIDACIYQKFDLIDTPGIESELLRQVLSLPYGPEIYLLLLRWNPLRKGLEEENLHQSKAVAVIGQGPAGLAMSYYLLMSGYTVYGYEALSLEGAKPIQRPIQSLDSIVSHAPKAFGGVMSYGITARWNKQLLDLLWVGLTQFENFHIQGNMRLGGSFTITDLMQSGFKHVVLATGAGLPHTLSIPGAYAPGMIHANTFLMQLHLSGELNGKLSQGIQLPVVVIGGGLTAVDAATEAQAYYIRWVIQVCFYVENLNQRRSYQKWYDELPIAERKQLNVWYEHGRLIRSYQSKHELSKIMALIHQAGGVSIVYHKKMRESVAYRQNYQELQHALDQGVLYQAEFQSQCIQYDNNGVYALEGLQQQQKKVLPAATILLAIGTQPNIAYYYENRSEMQVEKHSYILSKGVIADTKSYQGCVSVIGDLHQDYTGSVVKAIASAKNGYQSVIEQINLRPSIEEFHPPTTSSVINRVVLGHGITQIELPHQSNVQEGMYFRLSMVYEDQRFTARAVVVKVAETITLWVNHQKEDRFVNAGIDGIMGPSGTRLLGQSISQVLVVATNAYWPWVMAAYHIMQKRGGEFYLQTNDRLPGFMLDLQPFISHGTKEMHVLYALPGKSLKHIHQNNTYEGLSYSAVADGEMLCMLKGVCAQCVQWQVDKNQQRMKTVFTCSWPTQPVELIDFEHLSQRQVHTKFTQQLFTMLDRVAEEI
jgi:NADPH-dependent glutamate synthase beta subunit-like oxidoreductase